LKNSSKKKLDKRNNKLNLSAYSNKDKDNKFRIKPNKKSTKNNRESNENDFLVNSQIQKKNYSESPTNKKSFLVTDNTNNDYSIKGNQNQYKRNNSSNMITNSYQNQHNHLNEESIELIIPTPYPKNVNKFFNII